MPRDSVEAHVKHSLRWMVFWRLVGDFVDMPAKLCTMVVQMLAAVTSALQYPFLCFNSMIMSVSKTIMYLELEQARRHRILSGVDLGVALGEPMRYGGLVAGRGEEIQDMIHEQMRLIEEPDE